ncbi:MAG: FAD-binding protein, partial [Deltaproteobacteria bacterium]|nr:FAD-binding protein [Deltaproteobacteria bacterium]
SGRPGSLFWSFKRKAGRLKAGRDKVMAQYSLFFIQRFKGKVIFNVPMSGYTSLRIGGCADVMAFPQDEGDLKDLLVFAETKNFPYYVLGAGTNLLVRDGGIRGIVINMADGFKDIAWQEEDKAVVGAGVRLAEALAQCRERGMGGIEFAANIPGTVGGAVAMNAGAYGSEMKDVVEGVEVIGRKGHKGFIPKSELNFSYRRAEVPRGAVIARVHMRFEKKSVDEVAERIRAMREKRKASREAHRRGRIEGRKVRGRAGVRGARQLYRQPRQRQGQGRPCADGAGEGQGIRHKGDSP